MSPKQSRLIEWQSWEESRHSDPGMTGLDYLQKLCSGAIPPPPIFASLDFRLAEVSAGKAVYVFTPSEIHYNTIGTVHGGVASTLLDSAMGSAVHSMQPLGMGHATVELKVNLVRAITMKTGPMRCEGQVLHLGRRMATAEGRLVDGAGKLYAHGSTTLLLFPAASEGT
ncbi:PaaI family thioesterase [Azospirillum doebereinerae]